MTRSNAAGFTGNEVAYQFAQVGDDAKATAFLDSLDQHPEIGRFLDATSNYEREAEQWHRRSGGACRMTPDLYLVKLLCGAFDNEWDSKDEGGAAPGGFAPQPQGFSAPLPGVPAPQPCYTPPQPGYTPPQPGYTPPQPGYTPQQAGAYSSHMALDPLQSGVLRPQACSIFFEEKRSDGGIVYDGMAHGPILFTVKVGADWARPSSPFSSAFHPHASVGGGWVGGWVGGHSQAVLKANAK